MSRRSNPLPKQRSNDWLALARACQDVREILREHSRTLHKFSQELRQPNQFWVYVPIDDVNRLYNEGGRAMEIIKRALKGR